MFHICSCRRVTGHRRAGHRRGLRVSIGAQAQAQAVTNINATVSPTPATQSISLATGTATSTSVSGSTGNANASVDLGTGELKVDATSTAGFTSMATGWEFVTFSGSGTVDFSFDIDGSLSNLYNAGMVYVEPAVRVYDVTSWTSYFGSTGGIQFTAYNGSGSPFPTWLLLRTTSRACVALAQAAAQSMAFPTAPWTRPATRFL